MAKKKISGLPAGSALNGTELVPIVQTGTTKRITTQDIANLGNASGVEGSGTINTLAKFTAASTIGNSLLFDNGTSVGIGTALPSVAAGLGFVLNGQAGQTRLAFKNTYTGDTSGDGVQFALIGGSSAFVFQNRESDGYFSFETNGNEVFRTSGTNIGIGTTSPTSKLQISSNTTSDGLIIDVLSKPRITLRDRDNSDTIIGVSDYGTDNFFIDTYSGNAFNINGATRNILIGRTTDVASSKLTIESTTQGVLVPRMTTTQINAIVTPATGLIAYNTTLATLCFYDGTIWNRVVHLAM